MSKRKRDTYYTKPARKKRRVTQQPKRAYVENKGLDTVIAFDAVTSSTNNNTFIEVMNLVPPGTGSWNRIGKRIQPSSLRIRGNIEFVEFPATTTANLEGVSLRMLVVYDKQPSGNAIPSFDDIFGYTTQDGTEASAPYASLKYDNVDRFRVLRDTIKDFNLTAVLDAGTDNIVTQRCYFDEFVKLPNTPSIYSGQSATQTISDISTGAIYFIARRLSNDGKINIDAIARLRYTDN